jgi:hypothetical protein
MSDKPGEFWPVPVSKDKSLNLGVNRRVNL